MEKRKELATETPIKKEQVTVEDSINGLSLASAFLIVGALVLLLPDYLHNKAATYSVAYCIITIGLFGLGHELNKLNGDKNKTLSNDFAIGFMALILWMLMYYHFDNAIANLLILSLLFMGVYGISRGAVRFIFGVLSTKSINDAISKGIFTLINFTVAIAALYEALKKFGIIGK